MISELSELVSLISTWVKQGLRTEDILERINNPDGVAQYLLERAVARREAGDAYLGLGGGDE